MTVNMIGLAFGDLLVRELGMEWSISTGEFGKDIVVRGAGWVVRPRDFVHKRFGNDESGFMTAMCAGMREQLEAASC
jgi:hypothetical protein